MWSEVQEGKGQEWQTTTNWQAGVYLHAVPEEDALMPGTWRSPNELLEAAKEHQLGGRDPVTMEDWCEVVNFWAYNIDPRVMPEALLLMTKLYDMPEELTDDYIKEVAAFQSLRQVMRKEE